MILKDHLPGVFFVKILENNNKSNSLEENLILVETIPIKEYTYNRLVVSFGGYNAYGKTRTLVYFKDKICEIKNKFVKAIFY